MSEQNKILIAGNHFGIIQLLKSIKREYVSAVVVPYNRPESINMLKIICFPLRLPLIIHHKNGTEEYYDFLEKVKNTNSKIMISNSYPLIFKEDLLSIFKNNAFNIHSSLLPRNRGCSPINWAIMNGDEYTGVTIHLIDNGIDTGDVIFQDKVKIDFYDTNASLYQKLKNLKVNLIKRCYNDLLSGNFERIKQDITEVSYNKDITSRDMLIDLKNMTDLQIYNLIRANIDEVNQPFYYSGNEKIKIKKMINFENIPALRSKEL